MLGIIDRVRKSLVSAREAVRSFHRDERGAEGLEKILILAAVALPLLGLLIYFRDDLKNWLNATWGAEKVRSDTKLYGDGGTYSQ
jgi:Flp pilus assembly pilin Flp